MSNFFNYVKFFKKWANVPRSPLLQKDALTSNTALPAHKYSSTPLQIPEYWKYSPKLLSRGTIATMLRISRHARPTYTVLENVLILHQDITEATLIFLRVHMICK